MDAIGVLVDGFERVGPRARACLDGVDDEGLTWRIEPGTNTLAWLVWHMAREQDAQVAGLAGGEQVWTAGGWFERFALPFGPRAMGYGQSAEEVALVVAPADLLLDYLDAATEATLAYLATLGDDDLDEVVDTRWDPPVTRGVRLVSILGDDLEHLGQAEFVRGVLDRSR